MRLLFLHGAGGFVDDRSMADGLGALLDADVDMPRLPDEDMSYAAWAAPVRERLTALGGDGAVVAHSFGASILLRLLVEEAPVSAVLLAMPDWGPDGWDVPEYLADGPEPTTALSLHHCRDDTVVPVAHLATHAARLPSARVYRHDAGGHQFDGILDQVAGTVRGVTPR